MKLGPFEIIRAASPPPGEIGGTGTLVTPSAGGTGTLTLTEEDYNQDLLGTKLYDEIDRMRRSDSQVRAALSVVKLPILAADWHIEPPSDSTEDKRIAEWMETKLFDGLFHSWEWVLRHMLLHLDFGTMPFETVWEVKDDPEFRQPLAVLTDLAPRMPRTITGWLLDDSGHLAGIKQQLMSKSFQEVTIPADRLLVFVNEQEGSNYRGTSILRAARKDWLLKERAQRANAVALEKRTAGVDVGTLGSSAQAQDKKGDAEAALMSVRVHERAYMLETDDFKYRVQGIDGTVLDPLPTINYHDLMILRGILAEFLAMGTGGGSLAMHRDKSSFFLMALGAVAKQITGTINRTLIPRWMAFNFPDADIPELTHSRLDRRDAVAMAEALGKLIPTGAITVDQGLEDELRELLELPEMEEFDEEPGIERPAPAAPGEEDEGDDEGPGPTTTKARRPSSAQRGYGYRWQKLRRSHLKREPNCRECGVRATEVDHILPRSQGGLDEHSNLQSLCHSHHSVKTRRESASRPAHMRAPRTLAEKVPDFVAMAIGLDSAEAQIVRAYLSIQSKQVDKLIDEALKAIQANSPERLENINVPFKAEAGQAFNAPLENLYRQGQVEVRKEFTKMTGGRPPVRMASPLDPADDDSVKAWLRLRSRSVANALAERLRGAMLRVSLDMMRRGEVDRETLTARLLTLSERDIKREAKQATSEALNLGRESVAEQNKELIQAAEYSAIMDEGSCDPCKGQDGTTFEFGSEAMRLSTPPYRHCSGFGNPRCRCVFIYTFTTEAEARG